MSPTNPLTEIPLGTGLIRLFLNNQVPTAEFLGQYYTVLWFLVQNVSELSDPSYLKEFSEISNFFWKGIQFQTIDSIEDFQKQYVEQVELEKNYQGDVFPYRLTDYKIFDVSVMHSPLLDSGNLYYYVYHTATGLPYRVVCPFPYVSTSTLVHYQTLPLKEEASFMDEVD
jgi:hypothetical protein